MIYFIDDGTVSDHRIAGELHWQRMQGTTERMTVLAANGAGDRWPGLAASQGFAIDVIDLAVPIARAARVAASRPETGSVVVFGTGPAATRLHRRAPRLQKVFGIPVIVIIEDRYVAAAASLEAVPAAVRPAGAA